MFGKVILILMVLLTVASAAPMEIVVPKVINSGINLNEKDIVSSPSAIASVNGKQISLGSGTVSQVGSYEYKNPLINPDTLSVLSSNTGNLISASTVKSGDDISRWKKNLTDEEKKLPSEVVLLLSPKEDIPKDINISDIKSEMIDKNQLKITSRANVNGVSGIDSSDLIYVYISVFPGYPTSIVDSYLTEKVSTDEEHHIIAAWVKLSQFDVISTLAGVRQVSLVIPPIVNTGAVTSEGDAILKSDQVRSLTGGPDGTGIKVGVISDGVDNRSAAIASGDLPSTIQVLNNTQGGDEGTAMCEIVHDLAPGASIAFSDMASNTIEFAQHMQDLADAGCNVIVDDIGYANEPFFEDGVIAQKADSLYANNKLVVSSAGNAAQKHWSGLFTPLTSYPLWNDFSSAGSASPNPNSTNSDLYVLVPPGGYITAILQWNDKWGSSGNDYDLFLYDAAGGSVIARSIYTQSGTGDPFEITSVKNTGTSTGIVGIEVKKYSGDAKILDVQIWTNGAGYPYGNPYNIVPSSSTYGHSSAAGTIGVGAIDVSESGNDQIESFSSQGPRLISYPATETRNKPDITGVDGNLITGAGGFGVKEDSQYRFFGTSAAAPHVAALGALLWSKNPSGKTAAEIRTALTSTAVDLGTPGFDMVYGSGRADALSAYNLLYPAVPTITSITPSSAPNSGPIACTIAGTNFQASVSVTLTKTGCANITGTSVVVTPPSRITCTLPILKAAAGSWNVVVTNANGQVGTLPNGFTIGLPAPVVTGISPSSGFNSANLDAVITGNNFRANAIANLKLGKVTKSVTIKKIKGTQISCTLPLTKAVAGKYTLIVQNTDGTTGTKANAFTVKPAGSKPTIKSISPASGLSSKNTAVTITGTSFRRGVIVEMIKDKTVKKVTVKTFGAKKLICSFPTKKATKGAWNVRITNIDGTTVTKTKGFTVKTKASTIASESGSVSRVVLSTPASGSSADSLQGSTSSGGLLVPIAGPVTSQIVSAFS